MTLEILHQQRHRPTVHRDMVGDQQKKRILLTLKVNSPPYGPAHEIEGKGRRFHYLLPHTLPAPGGGVSTGPTEWQAVVDPLDGNILLHFIGRAKDCVSFTKSGKRPAQRSLVDA